MTNLNPVMNIAANTEIIATLLFSFTMRKKLSN